MLLFHSCLLRSFASQAYNTPQCAHRVFETCDPHRIAEPGWLPLVERASVSPGVPADELIPVESGASGSGITPPSTEKAFGVSLEVHGKMSGPSCGLLQ